MPHAQKNPMKASSTYASAHRCSAWAVQPQLKCLRVYVCLCGLTMHYSRYAGTKIFLKFTSSPQRWRVRNYPSQASHTHTHTRSKTSPFRITKQLVNLSFARYQRAGQHLSQHRSLRNNLVCMERGKMRQSNELHIIDNSHWRVLWIICLSFTMRVCSLA